MSSTKKTVNVFSLAVLNIATILSIRNWPFMAEYGFASLFFLLLTMLCFFIPCAFVSAELASTWPQLGGIYVWVKEALGHRWGFLASWLLWLENIAWYPTILSFIAGTLAFAIKPELASNPLYTFSVILLTMWVLTFINLRGTKATSMIGELSVLLGTFIPGMIIIILGFMWVGDKGAPSEALQLSSWLPNLKSVDQLAFLAGIMLSFGGIELSAIHAKDVENPRKNYPKAIFYSAFFILTMTLFGVLSIVYASKSGQISFTSGAIETVTHFFHYWNLDRFVPLIAILMVVGALGTVSSWIVGPTRALLVVAQDGDLPSFFNKSNRFGMPVNLIVTQAVIVSLVSLVFVYLPSVSASFWILSVLSAQLYLLMYLLMFISAIILRYKKADVQRHYTVPFGKPGLWIFSSLGIFSCLFGLIIGFFPPEQLASGSKTFYYSFLGSAIIISCLIPYLILIQMDRSKGVKK